MFQIQYQPPSGCDAESWMQPCLSGFRGRAWWMMHDTILFPAFYNWSWTSWHIRGPWIHFEQVLDQRSRATRQQHLCHWIPGTITRLQVSVGARHSTISTFQVQVQRIRGRGSIAECMARSSSVCQRLGRQPWLVCHQARVWRERKWLFQGAQVFKYSQWV